MPNFRCIVDQESFNKMKSSCQKTHMGYKCKSNDGKSMTLSAPTDPHHEVTADNEHDATQQCNKYVCLSDSLPFYCNAQGNLENKMFSM